MNRRAAILAGLFGAFALTAGGCSPPAPSSVDKPVVGQAVARAIDKSAISQASEIYAELVLGKNEALLARLPSELRTPQNVELLSKMRDLVPAEQGKPAVLVGHHLVTHPAGDALNVIQRYDYPSASLLLEARFARETAGSPWTSTGFYLGPASKEALGALILDRAQEPPPPKAI